MGITLLSCQDIHPNWVKSTGISDLENSCHIWKVAVGELASYLESLKEYLSQEEKSKSNNFHFKKDQDNFIIRRACLRILLGKYIDVPPRALAFTIGKNKRPILDPQHKHRPIFNISHTDDMILIGISNQEIGVDVEKMNPKLNYSEIMDHSFTNQERGWIIKSDKPIHTFYTVWTRKEAILKACSKGILGDLKEIQCLDGIQLVNIDAGRDSWVISSFQLHDLYSASLASPINCPPDFFQFIT